MKLLIADTDGLGRQRLADLLVTLGHSVVEVSSTHEALGRINRESFDLILADGDSANLRLSEILRAANRRTPSTRVVWISRSHSRESIAESEKAGYAGFLAKPYRPEHVRRLLEHLGAGTGPSFAAVSGGGGNRGEMAPARLFVRQDYENAVLGPGERAGVSGLKPSSPLEVRTRWVLRIDANASPPNLLGRLLVGSYITGQDQILIGSEEGLTAPQREEIRHTAARLLGTTVIQDSERLMEVQNFLDPGKHELPRLLQRVVRMLQTELQICRSALAGSGPGPQARVDAIEDEIDRFYLLIVRQLLLSSDSPRIARQIDVESHHYQMGYRLVAKVLEVTGDRVQGIATDIEENLAGMRALPPPVGQPLTAAIERLEDFLARTMDAFARLSIVDANAILNSIARALPEVSVLSDSIARHLPDRKVAVAAERILSHLVMSMEMLVIVNETTINRSVEPETVAPHGARVSLEPIPPGLPESKVHG